MKKPIMCIILILLLLVMVGCEQKITSIKSKPKSAGNASASTTETKAEKEEVVINQSYEPGVKTKIDLVVADAYFVPTFPSAGEEVELNFIVQNIGMEKVSGFYYNIKIYKDGAVWKEEKDGYAKGLLAGNRTKIEKKYVFTSAGKYSAEVYVDPDNNIPELIETNNYAKSKADATIY
ncbi:MAG: hypothetical protein N3D84_03180 [Candidatus Woesearchaeota archaeon]|nr:hypothetical protein [Candidatus Woesearchaeota archaeon]